MSSTQPQGEAANSNRGDSNFSSPVTASPAFFDLPHSSTLANSGRPNRGWLDYIRKMKNWTQMDWEMTTWQMAYICTQPTKVYDTTKYHKQIKNQWARDDPGFVVLLVLLLVMAVIAWCAAFRSLHLIPKMVLYVVIVDFLLLGLIAATIYWFVTNTFMIEGAGNADARSGTSPSFLVNQRVEWRYSFDVHCNSFFPAFLVLHVLQFLMLPFILSAPSFISTLISNTVFLLAFAYYHAGTALGYSVLPFITRQSVFMIPNQILVVLYLLSLVFQFNISKWFLTFYFPNSPTPA